MNKIFLMGRLTRDPEVRYSQGASQTAVGRFSIAVDRRFKREGDPSSDFFNCTAFGKQAEFVERYLTKGTKIVVAGRIQNNNYTNKDGQMVYGTAIMVDEIEFAESKSSSYGGAAAQNQHSNGSGNRQSSGPVSSSGDGFMNIPDGIDEELPFN